LASGFGNGERFDPAIAEQEDPVGEASGLVPVVGDVKEGDVGAATDIGEDIADIGAGLVVEGTEGFIETEYCRVKRQGSTQRDPLGFASGKSLRMPIQQRFKPKPTGKLVHPFSDPLGGPSTEVQGEGQMLADGQVCEEGSVLRNEPKSTRSGRFMGHIATVNADAAGKDRAQSADGFEQRGLAGAGSPHQGGVASPRDPARDVAQPEAAHLKADLVEFDHFRGGG